MNIFQRQKKVQVNHNSDENPYLSARMEWEERYGSYISRSYQLTLLIFIVAIICVLSLSLNILQNYKSTVVPYIVELDNLGNTGTIQRIDQNKKVPESLIRSSIAESIKSWRTVTIDKNLQQSLIEKLSFYVAGQAKGVIKTWYEQNDPYVIAEQGKTVHIEIQGTPLPVSKTSYRVEWIETVRGHTGIVIESNSYEATATIQITSPTTERVLLQNPGGVYIVSLAAAKIAR